MALWDIKGKATGRPVFDLLGGKFRNPVRLYANGWFRGARTPDEYAAAAKAMVALGNTASEHDPFQEMQPFHSMYQDGQISHEGEQLGCWTSAKWDSFGNREVRLLRVVP